MLTVTELYHDRTISGQTSKPYPWLVLRLGYGLRFGYELGFGLGYSSEVRRDIVLEALLTNMLVNKPRKTAAAKI